MNKFYTFLAAILLTTSIFAQVPDKMSYQAVIRDSGDALVVSQAVGMQISILQTTAAGTAVYVETQTPTTNVNGLVTLEIGTGTPVTGTFAGIDWSADTYFIKTETDPTGGSSYTITGTTQLLSVPYALHAKTAESVTRMTTIQRNALTPSKGMLVYNIDENKFQGYSGEGSNASNNLSSGAGCTSGSRGQSFIPTITGDLTKIEVVIPTINTSGNWTLNIHNGAGVGGAILGSQNVSISSVGTLSVTLSTTIPVISGQIYTFNFTSTGGANACFSHQNPESYMDGAMYIDNVVNGVFDMNFTIYLDGSWVNFH